MTPSFLPSRSCKLILPVLSRLASESLRLRTLIPAGHQLDRDPGHHRAAQQGVERDLPAEPATTMAKTAGETALTIRILGAAVALAPSTPRNNSSSFRVTILVSRFCVFWIRKTIKKVTIVVPVLMKSCQVSEYLK
jgi:hypothetical protein